MKLLEFIDRYLSIAMSLDGIFHTISSIDSRISLWTENIQVIDGGFHERDKVLVKCGLTNYQNVNKKYNLTYSIKTGHKTNDELEEEIKKLFKFILQYKDIKDLMEDYNNNKLEFKSDFIKIEEIKEL